MCLKQEYDLPQHTNKSLRLDLYLRQLKKKCDEKYASLQREICYDNNKQIMASIKASYKLPKSQRQDRSHQEDIIYWQIKQILTQRQLSHNDIISSLKTTVPECNLWNWNDNTWQSKIANICNGNSWNCSQSQFDVFFRWCNLMQNK